LEVVIEIGYKHSYFTISYNIYVFKCSFVRRVPKILDSSRHCKCKIKSKKLYYDSWQVTNNVTNVNPGLKLFAVPGNHDLNRSNDTDDGWIQLENLYVENSSTSLKDRVWKNLREEQSGIAHKSINLFTFY
jgi:hypothetical protein